MIKTNATNVVGEPEEQNRWGYLDAVDPVDPVVSSLTGNSSNAGCKPAADKSEAASNDGTGSTMSEAADGGEAVASDGVGSAIGEAADAVVEAAGGVASGRCRRHP